MPKLGFTPGNLPDLNWVLLVLKHIDPDDSVGIFSGKKKLAVNPQREVHERFIIIYYHLKNAFFLLV